MCANALNKSQHAGSLDENTKDSGTQIPTIPYIPLFGARAPAQHCWMCCANERNIVGPRFDDREEIKCWHLLALKFDQFQTSSNNFQQVATTHNIVCKHSQHVGPNNVPSCWPTMLRAFARGFTGILQVFFELRLRKRCQRQFSDERPALLSIFP